jgi:hypothetical protein
MRLFPGAFLKWSWFDARWNAERRIAQWLRPEAIEFYDRLFERGYCPERFIRIVENPDMIYVSVSKAASTRIKAILSEIAGRQSRTLNPVRKRKFQEPVGLRQFGFAAFHKMAVSSATLRFSFVRNPYERLVSCWANKFHGLPLVPGHPKITRYLELRNEIDPRLPVGPERTMSFSDFVVYACATNAQRVDQHWNVQSDVLEMPGIRLDMIGKVETFAHDISSILDHAGADAELRGRILNRSAQPLNPSTRGRCAQYFNPELASMAYRAYERDFDTFGYKRALPE